MPHISKKMWITPLLGLSFSVIASPENTNENISGNITNDVVEPTYIISSCKDLESIGKGANYPGASHEEAWPVDGHYELGNDIDCSATSDSSDDEFGDEGFRIIGDQSAYFTGSLNGNNYTIKNLYQRSELTGGIFYRLDPESLIQNLSIESAEINAPFRSGILSSMSLGDITNLKISGSVTQLYPGLAIEPIGGVSATGSGNYHNIHANVHIQGGIETDGIGGLFGMAYPGFALTDSSVTGSIRHGKSIGGMVGNATQSGTIHNSFVYDMTIETLPHSAERFAGGLIGISSIRDIKNVYVSNVDISSHGRVQAAGLIGNLTGGVPVAAENAYVTGRIVSHADSNNEIAAGFIAKNVAPGTVEHGFTSMDLNAGFIYRLSGAHAPFSYYNKDREYTGSVQDTASQPTSKKELKKTDWYITHLNWTEDDWAFKKGYYPILKGQDGNVLDNQEWVRVK